MDERPVSRYFLAMRLAFLTLACICAYLLAACSKKGDEARSDDEPPEAPARELPSAKLPDDFPIQPLPGDRVVSLQRSGSPGASAFVADFVSDEDWVGVTAHYEAELLSRGMEVERKEAEGERERHAVIEGRNPDTGSEARLELRQERKEPPGPIRIHLRWVDAGALP